MKRIISSILICFICVMLMPFGYVSADDSGEWWKTYDAADNAFDYYIEGDPGDMSDADFFGVWDSENGVWTTESLFAYDLYPGLEPVKEAVMDGDYDLAKEELQAYYSSVKGERVKKVESDPGSRVETTAYLLSKNAYTVDNSNLGFVRDCVKFGNDWKTIRTNISNSLTSKVVGVKDFIGFGFYSVDKYPTQGEIKARESGSPARLELVINGGVQVTIEACADGTIRGGKYEDTNFGFDETLKIQTSGTWNNYDEDTHFAYVKFDISFLKETDKVESAYLVYEGRNASGTGTKEIVVYAPSIADWAEDTLNFKTYSHNTPFWSEHDKNSWDYLMTVNTKNTAMVYYRGATLHDVAELYSYSGKEEHAFTFLRQHMAYVNNVGLNLDRQAALDVTVALTYQTSDIYHVIDSPYTTPELFTAMLKDMYIKAEWTCEDYYFGKSNNWGGFAAEGVYNFICRFPEFKTNDRWLQRTKEQYTYLLDAFTFDDGMCLELSLNYTVTLLGTVQGPVSTAKSLGKEVPFEDGVLKEIHGAVQTLIYCSAPNFGTFQVGDAAGITGTYEGTVKSWYDSVFTDDPEFEYVATGGRSGALPKNPTTHYPVGLRTYMRSSWDDPNALSMMLTGKGVGSHRDNDVLSLCMYAYGQYLLTDQGYATKSDFTEHTKEYFGHAARHNLVTINGQDHYYEDRDGKEEGFESNMMYDFIEYSSERNLEAKLQRSALYLKDQKFWIITDFADPVDDNEVITYEQHWHMVPEANMTLDEETYEARSNMTGTANVIVRPVDIDKATSSLEHSRYVTAAETYSDSKKLVVKQEVSGNSKYSTVIFPVNVNDDYSVESEAIDLDGDVENINAFVATITNELTGEYDYYYYYHHNQPEFKQDVTVGTLETDASTMLVQLDEKKNVVSVFLMNATYLKNSSLKKDNVLFKANSPVAAVAYKFTGDVMQIQSSSVTTASDLENLTIYAGNKNIVTLNDELVDCKKSGGYAYFADSPIVEGTEVKPEQPGGSSAGGGHGTGGGGGGGGSASVVKPKPEDNTENEDNKEDENQVINPPVTIDNVPTNIAKELDGHWGEEEITSLYKAGIVTGDTNGLRLKDSISRAEFTALIVRALGLDLSEYNNTFLDIDSDDWHAPYVATAYAAGLVSGADGMFRPNDTITREEMCKIIACAADDEFELKQADFKDTDSISPWALEYVNKAYSLGIVNGMDDGSFLPKNNALREQAFVILARFTNLFNKESV